VIKVKNLNLKDYDDNELAVLFVLENSALNRGMNTGLENLAWGLAHSGVQIHILCGGSKPSSHKYNLPDKVIYHFTEKSGKNPLSFLESFKNILDEHRISVTIGWIINLAPLVAFAKDRDIAFISNQGQMAPRSILLSFLRRVILRKMSVVDAIKNVYYILRFSSLLTKVISISNSVQQSCIRTYRLDVNKCMVIPRGVDTDLFSYKDKEITKGKVSLLYAGNILPPKGIDDLIESLRYIEVPVSLILCGKGDEQYIQSIQDKVVKYNMGHKLIYAGPQSQERLVNFYKECDIFVFPSHSEGLGKVLIEAMSCGCPIVCSDINTFKEIITNGHDGLISKVKSPKNLAETIIKYIENPELRKKCGMNARRTIEKKFSKKAEIDGWIRLLKS